MNYKITFNGSSYTVWRRKWGGWASIPHPLGKVMRTRQHAVNFLRLYKERRRNRCLACPCSTVEYFY